MDATHINTTTENEHVKALSVQKSAHQSKFTSKTKEKNWHKSFHIILRWCYNQYKLTSPWLNAGTTACLINFERDDVDVM